jgi:hypothetical protein
VAIAISGVVRTKAWKHLRAGGGELAVGQANIPLHVGSGFAGANFELFASILESESD